MGEYALVNANCSGVASCWHFRWHSHVEKSQTAQFQLHQFGGEGRNRTKSSPTISPNILMFNAIFTLILLGFQAFSSLHGTHRTNPATRTSRTRLLKKSLKVSLKVFLPADSLVCLVSEKLIMNSCSLASIHPLCASSNLQWIQLSSGS